MRDLLEVEYNQKSLLYVIRMLERNVEQGEEIQLIINGAKYYLEALQMDLKKSINSLDKYIAETASVK